MQSYINSHSDSEEGNNNSNIIQNPLDLKKENFEKIKIINYFFENNILQNNIHCSICGLIMKLQKNSHYIDEHVFRSRAN